jgi:RNA methyltransferase, TrmH family
MSREPTEKVVGLAAAYSVLRVRPRDVLNIAYGNKARRELAELLREAARLRIAYRELPQEDLDALSETVHNEGVCLLVRQRPEATVDVLARALEGEGLILALDHVENPHNVGALLRSAAFFGAVGLLLSGPRKRALTPSSVRVAEGGAEHVPVCAVPSLAPALQELRRAGAAIVGADAHRGESATRFRFPSRVVLVLGSERHGLSPDLEAVCTDLVHIRGTDAVESLNVSVAAGILLALATRKGRAP